MISPTPVLVGASSKGDRQQQQQLQQRVTYVACGGFHTAVLTARGDLFTFGRNDSGQLGLCSLNPQLSPAHVIHIRQKVTKVACGVNHTICCTGR